MKCDGPGHHPYLGGYGGTWGGYGGTWGGYYPYWGYDSFYGGYAGYGVYSGDVATSPDFGINIPFWGDSPAIQSGTYQSLNFIDLFR